MRDTKLYFITGVFIFCLMGCKKPPRNFYPDQDDPGLSRLTSYGYNIATNYINGVAYINPYNDPSYFGFGGGNTIPTFGKILGKGTTDDTLALSWPIEKNTQYTISNLYINLLIIVPKNFAMSDFVALSGKRYTDSTNRISMSSNYYYSSYYTTYGASYPDYSDSSGQGTSNIYFINISQLSSGDITMTGLFNGNIGDTTITDGRFDFYLPSSSIHYF
jgi:hypothetical protein